MLNICSCPLVVSLQRRIENKRLQQGALEVLRQIATKWSATLRANNVASELPRKEEAMNLAYASQERLHFVCREEAVPDLWQKGYGRI